MTGVAAVASRLLPNARLVEALSTGSALVIRSGRPDLLDEDGWSELFDAGLVSVVDLRNADERTAASSRGSIVTHSRPVEDQTDDDFMNGYGAVLNTPQYYAEVLRRWPDMVLHALDVIIESAETGAVLVHCSAGRDRTGMIIALSGQLADVPRELILDDYTSAVLGANEVLRTAPRAHEVALDGDELEAWVATVRGQLDDFLERADVSTWVEVNGRGDLIEKARRVFGSTSGTRKPERSAPASRPPAQEERA